MLLFKWRTNCIVRWIKSSHIYWMIIFICIFINLHSHYRVSFNSELLRIWVNHSFFINPFRHNGIKFWLILNYNEMSISFPSEDTLAVSGILLIALMFPLLFDRTIDWCTLTELCPLTVIGAWMIVIGQIFELNFDI